MQLGALLWSRHFFGWVRLRTSEVPPELSLFNKRIALSLTKNKQIPNPECNPPGPLIQAELAKLHSVLDTLDFRKMNLLPLRRLTLCRI